MLLASLTLALAPQLASAQAPTSDPDLTVDDAPPLVVDEDAAVDPFAAVDTPDAASPVDAGEVDSGEGTTLDIPLDAGVIEVPPLPEPDALEAGSDGQPAPLPRTRRRRDDDDLADLPTAVTAPEIPTERELAAHLEARSAAVRSGDLVRADLELALIEELRVALAARNVVVASAQLIQEAKLAMDTGQLDVAAKRADAAVRLSPDLEAAHWMRARVHWRRDEGAAAVVTDALRNLLVARLSVFRNQISFLTQLGTLAGLALTLTIIVFVVLQLFKYVRYPAHDLAKRVPDFIGGGELVILMLVLALLPFGLGFGLGPSVALALAMVTAYQQPRERVVGWVAMGVLAAAPLVIYWAGPLVSFHGSRVDAMAEATSEAFAQGAEDRLQRAAKGREDYASAMVLAHRARLRGNVVAAVAAYRRAGKARPSDPVAANNLGVALVAQGKAEEAENAFRLAIQKGGGAEPHLNIALLMADRGIFHESTRYMNQAREKDAGLVAQHTLMSGSTSKKAAVAPFDEGLLWDALFEEGRDEASAIAAQLWRPMSGRLPPWGASILIVVFTLLGVAALRFESELSAPCPRCGLPADRHAQAGLCDQCTSVFLSAVAVEPSLKEAKERAVRRYQQRRRWSERLLALVAGVGHLWAGRPALGVMLFFPFALLALGMLLAERTIVHPWFIYVDESAYLAKATAAGVVLGVLSLLSLRATFEK